MKRIENGWNKFKNKIASKAQVLRNEKPRDNHLINGFLLIEREHFYACVAGGICYSWQLLKHLWLLGYKTIRRMG